MANFDSFNDVVLDILDRMDEVTDGTSDWDAAIRRAVVRAFHHLHNTNPWWWALKDPPGAFLTVAPITNRTLTVAASGTAVAATLSSSVTPDLVGRKIRPTNKNYFMRITVHGGSSASITLDAAPEALTAQACTIFQDEYTLAADLGIFVDGLWGDDGSFIELVSKEVLRNLQSDPPSQAWPPSQFCRLSKRKIMLSNYPDAVHRVEYPYCLTAADPSGATDLIIDQNFRWLLADAGLYFGYLMKSDKRAGTAKDSYDNGVNLGLAYQDRMMRGLSARERASEASPYSLSRPGMG